MCENVFCGVIFMLFLLNMANFNILDDDDYRDLFITQTPRQETVSLEEVDEFKTVFDPKYSDILDEENDGLEEQM